MNLALQRPEVLFLLPLALAPCCSPLAARGLSRQLPRSLKIALSAFIARALQVAGILGISPASRLSAACTRAVPRSNAQEKVPISFC